jgi:hypothetical protein
MRQAALLLTVVGLLKSAVVIDRIAVVVDKHVIKESDIERDLLLTQFLNRQPLSRSAEAKRKSAERLIEQTILRDEIAHGGYGWAAESNAKAMVDRLRQDRFRGSDPALRAGLALYHLDESELESQFLWQLTVLRFIDQRFRDGAVVSDEDVRNYYNQRQAQLKRENPRDSAFATLEPKIRQTLEGERVNQNFEEAMSRARQRSQIRYIKGAFE